SRSQQDGFFRFEEGEFVAVAGTGLLKADGEASHGSIVLDVDKDGDDDLLVARTDGIWLHLNDGGTFSNTLLDATMPEDTTPLGIGVADINRDGHFDMYVGGYIRKDLVEGQNIFNRPNYGGTSQMFLNNGDNSFVNITKESGLEFQHNTFFGIFVDVDEDSFEDLVVVHDTGQVRTWKNNGDLTFTNMPNPNSDFNSYPMGIAVGDYDNSGSVDFFFSNVGSTPPNFLIRGDTTDDQTTHWKWMLFRNDGGFQFSDQAAEAKVADYEFSWGAVFEDMNLDGREDLIVSENYVGLPFHKFAFLRAPGRFLIQNRDGEFAAVGEQAGVSNRRYSISPITADFNGDGRPDFVHVNIAGRSQAFLSKPGSGNGLKVILDNRIESIGAKVSVTLTNGEIRSKWFIRGEGLSSDSSPILIFGLGDQQAASIEIDYLAGDDTQADGPFETGIADFRSVPNVAGE
ncbi:MAG: CRTAC1 family protein, partial [Erythrobacter sp.]|uniref:CRTAC1 family protein n=1 Tax=Erythrobacter sp. TaxID=1042 RepID=UPI003299203A